MVEKSENKGTGKAWARELCLMFLDKELTFKVQYRDRSIIIDVDVTKDLLVLMTEERLTISDEYYDECGLVARFIINL